MTSRASEPSTRAWATPRRATMATVRYGRSSASSDPLDQLMQAADGVGGRAVGGRGDGDELMAAHAAPGLDVRTRGRVVGLHGDRLAYGGLADVPGQVEDRQGTA